MDKQPRMRVSQDLVVIPPEEKETYIITVEEWEYLKSRIAHIGEHVNFFHTIGSILLGCCGSALLMALTLDLTNGASLRVTIGKIIAWSFCSVTGISGGLSLYFSKEQRKLQQTSAQQILEQMTLIHKRYNAQNEDRIVIQGNTET